MDDDFQLISEHEASTIIGCSVERLKILRKSGNGPSYCQISRRLVGYKLEDINSWLKGNSNRKTNAPPKVGSINIRKKRTVWTYFILREFPRAVKIGRSVNPQQRLLHLQTGVDSKLHLIGQFPGDREKEIHGILADLRVMNEWFRWPDNVKSRLRLVGIHL